MRSLISLIRKSITELERPQRYILIAWLLVLLALAPLSKVISEQTLLQALVLSILIQVVFVLHVLYRSWGWWGMLRTTFEVVFLIWVVLAIVIRSGLPYGTLQYSTELKPQL